MRKNIVKLAPMTGQETPDANHSSVLKRFWELRERSQQQFQCPCAQDEQIDSRSQRPIRLPMPHTDPHSDDLIRELTMTHESKPCDLKTPQNEPFTEMVLDSDAPDDSRSVLQPVRSPVDVNGLLSSSRFKFLNSGAAPRHIPGPNLEYKGSRK